jgi:hypothetical protein
MFRHSNKVEIFKYFGNINMIMDTAILISYSLKKETPLKDKEKFRRVFLGYKDKSNNGNYEYNRGGLLTNISHLKPAKSLVIIKHYDKKKVIDLFKMFNVTYSMWKIILNKQDYKKLND